MAIFRQIEVRPIVNAQPASEYSDPANNFDLAIGRKEDARIDKVFESIPEANFGIQCAVRCGFSRSSKDSFNALAFEIYIDGKRISSKLIKLKKGIQSTDKEILVNGVKEKVNGKWQLRKFEFGTLLPSNAACAIHPDAMQAAQVGSIKVEVRRCKCHAKNVTNPTGPRDFDLNNAGISEKAMKGRGTDTLAKLGAVEDTPPPTQWHTKRTHEKPLCTFTFRYYTRSGLQNLGIIERPRPATPLEDKDPDSLDEKQLREYARRMKELAQQSEESSRLAKKKLREEQRHNNQDLVRMIQGRKRSRHVEGDSDVEEVDGPQKQKMVKSVAYVELDSD